MLSLTHSVVGGAIGFEINQPAIAFGLGIIAHFIADKIFHFWPELKKGRTVVMAIDALLTVALLIVLYKLFAQKPSVFWGATGGAVVDAFLVLTPLFKTKLGQWHTSRQPHKTAFYFLATDILLIAVAALWAFLRGVF